MACGPLPEEYGIPSEEWLRGLDDDLRPQRTGQFYQVMLPKDDEQPR
jgi:hypothetical protein